MEQRIDTLLLAIAAGEDRAFAELYEMMYRPVYILAVAITKQKALSEDIAQEVFEAIQTSADRYRNGCSGRAWIYAITRNYARYFLRRQGKEIINDETAKDRMTVSSEDCLSDLIVSEALAVLSDNERLIVILHVYNGMTLREIAETLQIPYGTIMWRYQIAKKKLRKHYAD